MLDASSAAEAAQAQLKAKPADASAHLALGRYLCLLKGDWEAGLPHLARGDNPELKALAEDDLKHVPLPWQPEAGKQPPAPVPAAAAMKLSDAWWELAEQAKGRQHAGQYLPAGRLLVRSGGRRARGGSIRHADRTRWQALGKLAVKVPRARVVVNSISACPWFSFLSASSRWVPRRRKSPRCCGRSPRRRRGTSRGYRPKHAGIG